MFSVKQNVKVCLKGENLTHHTNHLKFLNAIGAAVVVGSAVPLISSPPAVRGCFASTTASDYEDTLAEIFEENGYNATTVAWFPPLAFSIVSSIVPAILG